MKEPHYNEGEFVLLAKSNGREGNKLKLSWNGPWQIDSVFSPLVYNLKLFSRRGTKTHRTRAHANRIAPFATRDFEKRCDLDDITWDSVSLVVDRIVKVFTEMENGKEEFKLRIQWLGFETCSNTTEPLVHMWEFIPAMIKTFLKSPRGHRIGIQVS